MPLETRLNLADPDGFYAELVRLHDGLGTEESLKLDAKLILANHIGDRSVLDEALALAAGKFRTRRCPGP